MQVSFQLYLSAHKFMYPLEYCAYMPLSYCTVIYIWNDLYATAMRINQLKLGNLWYLLLPNAVVAAEWWRVTYLL